MSDTASATFTVDRRRVLSAIAGGALLAGLRPHASKAQPATPSAEHLSQLKTLSQTLCGGGIFDDGRTAHLATLLAADPALSAGLTELLQYGASTPTPAGRSTTAQATAQEILLYWYTGEFKGQPVENHAAIYAELQAWQAMYTPAWTTCKVYGAWAEPPTMEPQEPENA